MKSKFSLKNITKFVLILVSSAYIAYTNAGDFFNFPTLGNWETSGVWFASLIFIGMIFWHFMDLQTTISNYENSQPNIVVDMSLCTTLEDVVYDWRGQGKNRKPKYITKRYFLPLKQEISKNGIKLKDTDPVNAKIVFYDKGGKILSNLSSGQAFWYNDKPRAKRNSRTENDLIIKKSGQVEGIVLVIKEVGKPFLFAFNHNSYIPGTGDFRFDESMKIKTNLVYAYVHISDGNFEKTYWVKIINQPRKEHPLFELVESPLSKKK